MQGTRLCSAQAFQKQQGEPSGPTFELGSGQPHVLHPTACVLDATRVVYFSGGACATGGSACGLLSTPAVSSARRLQYYKRECTVGRACFMHRMPVF